MPDRVFGVQTPRVGVWPESVSSAGAEAVDLAAACGLELDPWQRLALEVMLGERPDGLWSAMECALIVPRQNGKNVVAEVRELAGLVLLGERLITHTAHLFPTCLEHFRRMQQLLEANDDVARLVSRVVTSHGGEAIEMRNGSRLLFRARSKGAGRGFSGDCIVFDEAFDMFDVSAMVPSLSAAPNPQLLYLSTPPVDGPRSDPLRRLMRKGRRSARDGDPGRLAYLEWSAEAGSDLDDLEALADGNPGLGRRLNLEFVQGPERTSMSAEEFARERLGIWVDFEQEGFGDVPVTAWRSGAVRGGRLVDPVWLGVDASPDGAWWSVSACGEYGGAGVPAVEPVWHGRARSALVATVVRVWGGQQVAGVVVDPAGPAASVVAELEACGVRVVPCTGQKFRAGCSDLLGRLVDGRLRWVESSWGEVLTQAAASAVRRDVGDSWVWDRRAGGAPVSPLVACTLALWGHTSGPAAKRVLNEANYRAMVEGVAS